MRIAVVGAGYYGCHLARCLIAAGHDVLIFERNGIFAGASGNSGIKTDPASGFITKVWFIDLHFTYKLIPGIATYTWNYLLRPDLVWDFPMNGSLRLYNDGDFTTLGTLL